MSQTSYHRASLGPTEKSAPARGPTADVSGLRFRWATVPLTMLLCVAQAIITVTAINTTDLRPNSTLIPVIGFGFVFIIVILINPLLRHLFRGLIQPLGRAELMSMTAALMVTAGVSTFGLAQVLVPMIAAPYNPEWNVPQSGWEQQLLPNLRRELYITDPEAITVYRQGIAQSPPQTAPLHRHVEHYRSVIQRIPWKLWLKPLMYWMVFVGGCYGIFWSLTYLVIGQWSQREKLIFPLAKLPLALLPEQADTRTLPQVMRSGLFWGGFCFSFLLLAYNAASFAQWIPLEKLALGMSSGQFSLLVKDSVFGGLAGGVAFIVTFTCIGIAFLLPLEISFSIWFYFWFGRLTVLVLIWLGHGQNFRDFPSDWTWTGNPVTTQGMGALLLFSGLVFYRAMRGYFSALTTRGGATLLPLMGFVVSTTVVIAWICWNHVPLLGSVVLVAFIILFTIGLMRVVAETGVFWHQTNAGFFHFYKMLGAVKLIPAAIVAPLIPIYAILFFDIKTFIAPNVVNAAELQRVVRTSRLRFHVNIVVSVVASVAVSIGHLIMLAYVRGAQQMNNWFFSVGPRSYMDKAARTTTMAFEFEPGAFAWFTSGAVWVALSMYLRQSMFWIPHPIGFIMNINPLIQYLWFSFFIGWLIKKIVVRYGGKASFEVVRLIMLGLIFGELLAIFLAGVLTLLPLNIQITDIDLNRYQP